MDNDDPTHWRVLMRCIAWTPLFVVTVGLGCGDDGPDGTGDGTNSELDAQAWRVEGAIKMELARDFMRCVELGRVSLW